MFRGCQTSVEITGTEYNYQVALLPQKRHAILQSKAQKCTRHFSVHCVSLCSTQRGPSFLLFYFLFLSRCIQPSCPLFNMCLTLTLYPFQLALYLVSPLLPWIREKGSISCKHLGALLDLIALDGFCNFHPFTYNIYHWSQTGLSGWNNPDLFH